MNTYLHRIFLAVVLIVVSFSALASDECARLQEEKGYPSYYCACKENHHTFVLPIDTFVSYDTIWYRGRISDLYGGLSAYLFSDCDLNFEVYTGCSAKNAAYQALFEQNKANAIDGESIKRKIESNSLVGDLDLEFYICISPVSGEGGRLIMRQESDGMPSTCDNPLYMMPGMSLYTTLSDDVYVIDPNKMYDIHDIILQWEPDANTPCQLHITSNTCDGPTVVQTILEANGLYILPAERVWQALENNELLYVHVGHAANTAGMIHCLIPEYEENYYEEYVCQGKGFLLDDMLITEPTLITYDTVHIYANQYVINYYDIMFFEPETQYDTLALKTTQLPYDYKGETISKFGDYDLTIHQEGECDEHFLLHVYHDIDTVRVEKDTLLCYGATFEYKGGKYLSNTSFTETSWPNQDTYRIDVLNVYFATTPDIVHDTIMQNERRYGKYFSQAGDFAFLYTNPTTYCTDSIILHVKPTTQTDDNYDYYYEDYTLCQGMTFTHDWFVGETFTSDTVLVDTYLQGNVMEVTIITVTFTKPEITYDTLSLKSTQLPYNYYKKYTISSFGDHDFTTHQDNTCDERYMLHVIHDIDTLYATVDTVLCQGLAYHHNGVAYTSATTFTEGTTPDADTYLLTTYNVAFTAPEMQYDTLSLKSVQLPYDYHGLYTISTFGQQEFLSHIEGTCDELYTLYVEHDIDTLYTTLDTVLCQGKIYSYAGVAYIQNTSFNDTLKLNEDTYEILTISVSFTAPEIVADTLSLKTTDLPYTYRGQYTVSQFGNYDVLITGNDVCDERYALCVVHDVDTLYATVDTTLCQGKIFVHNGVSYTSAISFVESTNPDADTYLLTTYNVGFLAPDIVADTLSLKTTDLPYTYRGQYTVSQFGNYDVLITGNDVCDERFALVVLHDIDTLYAAIDTTLCQGKIYTYNGVIYSQNTTFNDTVKLNEDTYQITSVSVSFLAPDVVADTLSLKTTDLPYLYRQQYTVSQFGNYDVLITGDDVCDERYALCVEHDIDTLTTSVDTFLCYGSQYEHEGVQYLSDTALVLQDWQNPDTWQIDTIHVTFAAVPDQVFDTLCITLAELPYTYREQVIEAFGDYEFMLKNEEGCVEQILLHVERHIPASVDDAEVYDRPRMVMRNGIIYILRGAEIFTLLGEKVE